MKTKLSILILLVSTVTIFNVNAQWQATNGPYGEDVYSFVTNGSTIFAGGAGVFSTVNNGVRWDHLTNGFSISGVGIMDFILDGTNLFAGTAYTGVYLSTNNGANWTSVNTGLADLNVNCLLKNGTDIFAGTSTAIYKTSNNGANWSFSSIGIPNTNIACFTTIGSNIFAGTSSGVYLSTNNGLTWSPVNSGLTNTTVTGIGAIGANLFVGVGTGAFMSSNNGTSWTNINSNLPTAYPSNFWINSLQAVGSTLFVGKSTMIPTSDGALYKSTNNGASWTKINYGLGRYYYNDYYGPFKYKVVQFGSNLLVGSRLGVHISSDNGNTWYGIGIGRANIGQILMHNGSDLFCGTINGLYITPDAGNTWNSINNGFKSNPSIKALCHNGSTLFAGINTNTGTYTDASINGDGLYISTNNGASWTQSDSGLTNIIVESLAEIGGNIFAGTQNGIFISTNNGTTWSASSVGLPTNTIVSSILSNGPVIFIITDNGLYISTNNGSSWAISYGGNCLVNDGTNVLCGTSNGTSITSNYGSSWATQSFPYLNHNVLAMTNTGSMLIAVRASQEGIVFSFDGGNTWSWNTSCYQGLGNGDNRAVSTNGIDIFLGVGDGNLGPSVNGVWRCGVSDITGINEYSKGENDVIIYPNPFNTKTTINFAVEQKNRTVRLTDVVGKVIRQINFSGKQLVIEKEEMKAGIYFVQITEENKNTINRKIIIQ